MRRGGARTRRAKIQPILKNTVMGVLSLVFVVLSLVCYLSIKGVFAGGNEFNSLYCGMYLWELVFTSPNYFATSFALDPLWAFAELVPLVIFTLALFGVVTFFVCAIFGRYVKPIGVLTGVLICVFSLLLLFMPYVNIVMTGQFIGTPSDIGMGEYFASIVDPQYTTIFIAPAVGVVQLVLSIVFLRTFGRR